MGCDIHLYVERKLNGVWEKIHTPAQLEEERKALLTNDADDADAGIDPETIALARDTVIRLTDTPYEESFDGKFGGRDYHTFSLLADVRNYGRGDEEKRVKDIISNPKGLPDDMSEAVMAERDVWAGDAHSYSWLTIEELWPHRERFGWEHEGWQVADMHKLIMLLHEHPLPTRIIFWFDN